MAVQVAVCSVAQLFALPTTQDSQSPIFCRSPDIKQSSTLSGTLRIPEYQRAYEWKEKQLQQLIDSIREHLNQNPANSEPTVPYYLGSLILHQNDEHLDIIDGQQRVTSLALMAHLKLENEKVQQPQPELRFTSPLSQAHIRRNLAWLHQNRNEWAGLIDFDKLQFTLVITDNPDQAYHFFETHNTDSVRLKGHEIIKAHHLRAIAQRSPEGQNKALGDVNDAAKKWEALQELPYLIQLVLKGRFWKQIRGSSYPSVRNPRAIRDAIVDELADKTSSIVQQDDKSGDIGFANLARLNPAGAVKPTASGQYYDLRQPLNAGWNTLNYLDYFTQLKNRYLVETPIGPAPNQTGFYDFYRKLILDVEGCGFIKPLYVTALLLYISQFSDNQLEVAAKKLFRVIYSRRVTNKVAVKESSIPSFIAETPVLDWICVCFTPMQLFAMLDSFVLEVDATGLGSKTDASGKHVPENSVKRRFIAKVAEHFKLTVLDGKDAQAYANNFAQAFDKHIRDLPLESKEVNQ